MNLPSSGESSRPYTYYSPPQPQDNNAVFEAFEAYLFNDDPEFRAGLPTVISAIRGQKMNPASIDEMLSRAQWFYFTRKRNVQIPWEAYAHYSRQPHSSPPRQISPREGLRQLDSLAEARRMMSATCDVGNEGMSFEMLVRLIQEGRADEVPREDVPDGIHDGPPSQATMAHRPKPWESQTLLPDTSLTPSFFQPTPPSNTNTCATPAASGTTSADPNAGTTGLPYHGGVFDLTGMQGYGEMSEEDLAMILGGEHKVNGAEGESKADGWSWLQPP
ncbi:hypothetical protein L202_01196 [Cryptococcus amylolentus CBS 6039]|uniref:Uncharacterized protein n=1 Tax=Cryptococcus amylolentus CBS 6039 TaxID=1295533 RepID=A0A1E3I2Y4_9TREE|nr:hypothetical protein L202_01196 [Cryptococcus amylolentus CBS 6039]ODN82952.1 hypothetical protein L202_01196 [Cryptococcus amylolentus CBS 6039]